MDLGLNDATAVVTGATKGMGRAVAESLATEGARVGIVARGQDGLDATAAALAELGSPEVLTLRADVANAAEVTAAFAAVTRQWGTLNVLVNTVGPAAGRFEQLRDEDWLTAFELGTMAAVRCVRAALELLRAAPWARIVNVSAHSTQRQSPILPAYTASKAALSSVSKNLARSLAPDGILVNTVSPGTIVTASFTEALRGVFAERGLDAADPYDVMRWIDEVFHQPADLGRAGLPGEVADVVTFLASRRNAYVTGANVNVDGGSDFV
ncbi:MAG TPA: SDR family oxidoreductase [Acidimicrobiales bacterium]|nr:SDR family oxidoreductase [Acidimicrobiales bacterium]